MVNPAAFSDGLATSQVSWSVLPQPAALARGKIGVLAASTSQAVTALTVATRPYGLQVTTGLPRLLSDINRTIVLGRSLFAIGALQLLLVTAAGLALAARLLAGHREEESALLRARGAAKWQVTRPVLAEALVVGVLAAAAGVPIGAAWPAPWLAWAACPRPGTRAPESLRWSGPRCSPCWRCAGRDGLAGAAQRVPGCRQVRAVPAGPARRDRPAGGDLALVGLAALAVWELHNYSVVARPASGTLGIDPVVAVAPALALAGVALVPLRALPLLARLTDKAAKRGRRLAGAIVGWQIGRRPVRQAGPVLLAVVAVATSTLALAGYASWQRSAADQAAYAVGSDVRLDSPTPASPGEAGAIARAPGVTATTPASIVPLSPGRLVALDASTAGATILLRPDLSPLPLATLWRRITPRRLAGLPVPGQSARLEVLVNLATEATGQRFGGAGVIGWLQDGGGGTYQVGTCQSPLGFLPADGRRHALIIPLPRSGQAPLRLLGLSLCFTLPPFDAARPLASPALRLRVLALATARMNTGPFGPPFARGTALASWRASASSQSVPARPPGLLGVVLPKDGTPPAVRGWHGAAGGRRELDFRAGHAPSPKVMAETSSLFSPAPTGQVTIMPRPPFPASRNLIAGIPAIATSSYLSGNHVGIGSIVPFSLDNVLVPIRIVASVTGFPTTPPASRVLIADLAAVQDLLVTDQAMPLPLTRWWLRTSHGQVPRRLPPGLSAADRARQQAALLHDALSVAPRQAMLAIGAAAVLLAALGFSVSVAASVRERRTQSAVFAALGVGRRAQAGQLCLEQLLLSVPAAAVGLCGDRPGPAAGAVDHAGRERDGPDAVGPGDTPARPGRGPGAHHRRGTGCRRCRVGRAQAGPGSAVAGGGRMRAWARRAHRLGDADRHRGGRQRRVRPAGIRVGVRLPGDSAGERGVAHRGAGARARGVATRRPGRHRGGRPDGPRGHRPGGPARTSPRSAAAWRCSWPHGGYRWPANRPHGPAWTRATRRSPAQPRPPEVTGPRWR